MQNFLIIRLSSLGDVVHTLPAFSALRRNFPAAKITWAVEEQGRQILDLVPGIDRLVVIDRKKWPRSVKNIKHKDQIALDFQGLVKSALLGTLSSSRRRIGFDKQNLKEPMASLFYTDRLQPFSEQDIHVISKNLRLLTLLGISEEEYDFPLRVFDGLTQSVEAKLKEIGFAGDKKIVVFNMGAAWETKRWYAERWVEVIEKTRLADAFPLLLWGSETEKELALQVSRKTQIPLSPFLSIKEVIALIKKASLLVSGDTFALQVACALDVPVVGLFGPTNPLRNGPFRPGDKAIFHQLNCNPCYKRTCPTLECLQAITVDEVAAAIKHMKIR